MLTPSEPHPWSLHDCDPGLIICYRVVSGGFSAVELLPFRLPGRLLREQIWTENIPMRLRELRPQAVARRRNGCS